MIKHFHVILGNKHAVCDHILDSFRMRELVYAFFVHLFVYFARVNFCPFSLPVDVRDWLQFVICNLPNSYL